MSFHPYLFFSGSCGEAFAFYGQVFGAEPSVMTFGDLPPGEEIPADIAPTTVMHASISVGDAMLMGSDDPSGTDGPKTGFAVSYTASDAAAVSQIIEALAEGGEITVPVEATFWAPAFGMAQDRFGVTWIVDCYPEDDGAAS